MVAGLAAVVGAVALLSPSSPAPISIPVPFAAVPAVPACPALPPAPAPWAFFDTFDNPSTIFNRSGQLDGCIWGVSRVTGKMNLGQNQNNEWATTTIQGCAGPLAVRPPNDIIVCNGQLREATNDNHDVTVLAMYPKQPFDWAGRTGTIVFDVSNDTEGTHAAWPELWITDKPSPAPFTHFSSWIAVTQHAVGIRFALVNGVIGSTNCVEKWSVDSAVVSRNYVIDDSTEAGHTLTVTPLDCVTRSNGTTMNHVEVRVSSATVDVWATDAGGGPLKHIASIPNANLSFTRGLVWIQDAHYNAELDKACSPWGGTTTCVPQTEHTFIWDNVGFDGPFTYRDLSHDVLDRTDQGNNLGWKTFTGEPFNGNTLPLQAADIANAASARLLLNFFNYDPISSFTYSINGHQHTAPWPYPGNQGFTPRTLALDVPLSDLVAGPNAIQWVASQAAIVANLGIVLVNVSGGPPSTSTPTSTPPPVPTSTPLPASPTTAPYTATPTATSLPTSTATSTAIPPTSTPSPTSTPTATTCREYQQTDPSPDLIYVGACD